MSFFTSLSGMRAAETDLRVISQNIANVESVGFKKSQASFFDLVADSSGADPRLTAGIGTAAAGITQDFSLGSLEQTGRGLDLAISGDGFFSTANPIGGEISFTRNGNFKVVANGQLQDSLGELVQGFPVDANGNATSTTPSDVIIPVVNAAGATLANVLIDERGVVTATFSDATSGPVAMIALASFPANDGLRATGQTKWQATGESGNPAYGQPGVGILGELLSGSLERSNVDLAEEMVSLLNAQRNFQANARAIDTATTISQTVLNLQR